MSLSVDAFQLPRVVLRIMLVLSWVCISTSDTSRVGAVFLCSYAVLLNVLVNPQLIFQCVEETQKLCSEGCFQCCISLDVNVMLFAYCLAMDWMKHFDTRGAFVSKSAIIDSFTFKIACTCVRPHLKISAILLVPTIDKLYPVSQWQHVLLHLLLSHYPYARGWKPQKMASQVVGKSTCYEWPSYVRGYHKYKSVWSPTVGETLRLTMELPIPKTPLPWQW